MLFLTITQQIHSFAPTIQIIAATHSPLILAAAEPLFDPEQDARGICSQKTSLLTWSKGANERSCRSASAMNRTSRFLPVVCALTLSVLAGCAHHPSHPPSPAPTSVPSAPLSPAPIATPAPYSYIYTPSPADGISLDPNAPQIHEVDLNERVLAAPGPIRVRVLTNPVVTTVTAHTMGHDLPLPQEASGVFGASDELPSVPFFLHHRTYQVQFVAAAPDGRSSSVTLPITLR